MIFQGRKWRVGRVGNCPPRFRQPGTPLYSYELAYTIGKIEATFEKARVYCSIIRLTLHNTQQGEFGCEFSSYGIVMKIINNFVDQLSTIDTVKMHMASFFLLRTMNCVIYTHFCYLTKIICIQLEFPINRQLKNLSKINRDQDWNQLVLQTKATLMNCNSFM